MARAMVDWLIGEDSIGWEGRIKLYGFSMLARSERVSPPSMREKERGRKIPQNSATINKIGRDDLQCVNPYIYWRAR